MLLTNHKNILLLMLMPIKNINFQLKNLPEIENALIR